MGILDAIFDVFDKVSEWIVSAVSGMTELFYVVPEGGGAGSLTLLGALAVVGLAMSVVFLIIGLIQNFLHWRS